jgi:hypothetical protein
VRRSPAAPRRQAIASGLGLDRSTQPAATAASAPRTRFNRGASRLPRTAPRAAGPRVAATRHGRLRVQAAHSAARARRHCAWGEPPGRPTLVRLVVGEVGEDGLQVGLTERPHRPTRPILVVEGPRSSTGHRVLLPDGAAIRAAGLIDQLGRVGFQVDDLGDSPVVPWRPDRANPQAQNLQAVLETVRTTATRVADALGERDRIALAVGGDCTVGIGTAAAIQQAVGPVASPGSTCIRT